MPEYLRSIASRVRGFVANRRSPPRVAIHLEVSLALSVAISGAPTGTGGKQNLHLTGYTRDISETGLGLIVPSIRIGGQYLVSEDRTLRIMLELLPDDAIEIYARPVRYTPLDEDAGATGYLVGVLITHIADADRVRYLAHIQTLKKGT